jgi:hypothetical protein
MSVMAKKIQITGWDGAQDCVARNNVTSKETADVITWYRHHIGGTFTVGTEARDVYFVTERGASPCAVYKRDADVLEDSEAGSEEPARQEKA